MIQGYWHIHKLLDLSLCVTGAYLGGALGHDPPLDRQDSIISIE